MTKEDFSKIRHSHIEAIKGLMQMEGRVFPQFNIFGRYWENPFQLVNHIVNVPGRFLESEGGKNALVDKLLPQIGETLRKDKFKVEAIAWTSEAWQRTFPAGEGIPENWKLTPVEKEVLTINLQTEDTKEFFIYEIRRSGKQVNGEGELVDLVELKTEREGEAQGNTGRFANIFERITQF